MLYKCCKQTYQRGLFILVCEQSFLKNGQLLSGQLGDDLKRSNFDAHVPKYLTFKPTHVFVGPRAIRAVLLLLSLLAMRIRKAPAVAPAVFVKPIRQAVSTFRVTSLSRNAKPGGRAMR